MKKVIPIIDREVLNIFCDASIIKFNNVVYGCPGSLVIDFQGNVRDYDSIIIPNSTNNESEIYAILLATQQCIKYKSQCKRINIFSDSRISVFGLREWMTNWVQNQQNGILMSTSGEVANQQIFLHIVNLIMNELDEFNLYHINGHMNPDNAKHIAKVMKDFGNTNNIIITPLDAWYLCYHNNLIDNNTRDELKICGNNLPNINRLKQPIIYPIPTDMDKYRSILDN